MNSYFSTFLTGFQEVINNQLTTALEDCEIKQLDDGLVIYQTSSDIEKVKQLKFFNNSFLLVDRLDQTDPNYIFKYLINSDLNLLLEGINFSKKKTFRIRVVKENTPTKVDNDLISQLEGRIYQTTKLNVNRAGADVEFWVMIRKEDFTLFGIRLTYHGNYEKLLQKGELRPELSNMLCLLSEPSKEDIFLDPFCGSGSIPIERARAFPYNQVLAGDIKPEIIDALRKRVRDFRKKITIGRWDAVNLQTFKDSSVDKIVTDPPWGIHSGKNLSLKDFYNKMLKEFNRILKPDGIIVILVSQQINMEEIIIHNSSFIIQNKYTTLVNGQKSAAYKITKN